MSGSFNKLFAKIRETKAYKREKAKVDFTVELNALMEKRDVRRADLARLLGVSPAYITKILRGEYNFTIEKIVDIADALNSEVAVHLSPKEENTIDWYRVIEPTAGVKARGASITKRRAERIIATDFDYPRNHQDGDNVNGYASAA